MAWDILPAGDNIAAIGCTADMVSVSVAVAAIFRCPQRVAIAVGFNYPGIAKGRGQVFRTRDYKAAVVVLFHAASILADNSIAIGMCVQSVSPSASVLINKISIQLWPEI